MKVPEKIRNRELAFKASYFLADVYSHIGKSDNAVKCCEQALLYYKKKPSLSISHFVDIQILLADIYARRKSEYDKAEQVLKELCKKINIEKDIIFLAKITDHLGNVHLYRNQYNEAIDSYLKAKSIYEKGKSNISVISTIISKIGLAYKEMGESIKAMEYFKKYLKYAEKSNSKYSIGHACSLLGVTYRLRGKYDEGLIYLKRALQIFKEIGDIGDLIGVLTNVGNIYYGKGEIDTALEYYNNSIEYSNLINDRRSHCIANSNVGCIFYEKGEYHRALKNFKESLRSGSKIGFKKMIATNYLNIGSVYFTLRDFSNAKRSFVLAQKTFNEINYTVNLCEISAYLSEKNFISALSHVKNAYKMLSDNNLIEQHTKVMTTYGTVLIENEMNRAYPIKKNIKYGIDMYKKAIAMAENNKVFYEQGKILLELANIHKRLKNKKEFINHLKSAREVFLKIGVEDQIKNIDALLKR